MAEGARFELAAHEVGAGFQDRWIKPLSHPSDDEIVYLRQALSAFYQLIGHIASPPHGRKNRSSRSPANVSLPGYGRMVTMATIVTQ